VIRLLKAKYNSVAKVLLTVLCFVRGRKNRRMFGVVG
jgi:hypothetical protein